MRSVAEGDVNERLLRRAKYLGNRNIEVDEFELDLGIHLAKFDERRRDFGRGDARVGGKTHFPGETVAVAAQLFDHGAVFGEKRLCALVSPNAERGQPQLPSFPPKDGSAEFEFDCLQRAAHRTRFAPKRVARRVNSARSHHFHESFPGAEIIDLSHASLFPTLGISLEYCVLCNNLGQKLFLEKHRLVNSAYLFLPRIVANLETMKSKLLPSFLFANLRDCTSSEAERPRALFASSKHFDPHRYTIPKEIADHDVANLARGFIRSLHRVRTRQALGDAHVARCFGLRALRGFGRSHESFRGIR